MKKILMLMSASLLMISCGDKSDEEGSGDSAKGSKLELSGVQSPLDKFEVKSSSAYKSGMNWNNEQYEPVLYIAVSNLDKIKYVEMYNNVEMPSNEGEVLLLFQFRGDRFKKGSEPTSIEVGDYPILEENFNSGKTVSCSVIYKKEGRITAVNLSMSSSTGPNSFTGTGKITKISDSMVEGTIEMKGADGVVCNLTFSEKIEQDFWAKDFKNGKL